MQCAVRSKCRMALGDRNGGLPAERSIEFRIGIHLGDVVEEGDDDLMGDGITSRRDCKAPGAICLSEDAYLAAQDRYYRR